MPSGTRALALFFSFALPFAAAADGIVERKQLDLAGRLTECEGGIRISGLDRDPLEIQIQGSNFCSWIRILNWRGDVLYPPRDPMEIPNPPELGPATRFDTPLSGKIQIPRAELAGATTVQVSTQSGSKKDLFALPGVVGSAQGRVLQSLHLVGKLEACGGSLLLANWDVEWAWIEARGVRDCSGIQFLGRDGTRIYPRGPDGPHGVEPAMRLNYSRQSFDGSFSIRRDELEGAVSVRVKSNSGNTTDVFALPGHPEPKTIRVTNLKN